MTKSIVSIYEYQLEKYVDNVFRPYDTEQQSKNGFSILGLPKNITGNGGFRFINTTIRDYSVMITHADIANMGIIGMGYTWKINDKLNFIASSDFSAKAIYFRDGAKVVDLLAMHDLSFSGYFRYNVEEDVFFDLGLAIMRKLTVNVYSLSKDSLMSGLFYRTKGDNSEYEESDYYKYDENRSYETHEYKFYYDSKFNLTSGSMFFIAHKNYRIIELPTVNLELKNKMAFNAYKISDREEKMINLFNVHPDNVKNFNIDREYYRWSLKDRFSANLYGIFPLRIGHKSFFMASIDLGFNMGEGSLLIPNSIFTLGFKYGVSSLKLSIENDPKLKGRQISFGYDFIL
ncbi:MAG: hypothetical protein LBP39_00915 [Rickettsiales bacterium]|nr:hypothetical protein [Rickettsiales bacterium]